MSGARKHLLRPFQADARWTQRRLSLATLRAHTPKSVYFHKVPHPDNFVFIERVRDGRGAAGHEDLDVSIEDFGGDVFRLEVRSPRWPKSQSQAGLSPEKGPESHFHLELDREGALTLAPRATARKGRKKGEPRGRAQASLVGRPKESFGICENGWLLKLVQEKSDRFFGMGEKWGPLEKSGIRTKFWNTDVWADFPPGAIEAASVDPPYASVPYLIVARGGTFFGILVDDPYPVFMATNPLVDLQAQSPSPGLAPDDDALCIGAADGLPVLYFLVGPTLHELTQKLQRLCGTTPRPPLWALGHHQSRWGYASARDLEELDERFEEHDVPCDGLWLDIDYMDSFKVFTLDEGHFPDPEAALFRLRERGRRVVAILDPGVKVDEGYPVYEQGLAGGHFCLTAEGKPFAGFVWPGRCHFPDFSRKGARDWWASHVSALAARGFDGFWIDMNDPSVGPVELSAMRFDHGRASHESYHNQYGLGMAEATRQGLLDARPSSRPFVLTRSAFTGISRSAAVWTGDNLSNWAHLRASLPISLNLALSGVPFNAPDVPGFGGDATDELCVRWYQACFLFPFLRNHSVKGSRRQEPWAFSEQTLAEVRHYVRLRYRLTPYLYQLFVEQERSGAAILRPSFFDSRDPELSIREDQFLVGPALLQAPVLEPAPSEEENVAVTRNVELPEGDWFCARTGEWLSGKQDFRVSVTRSETPLYARAGSLVPLLGEGASQQARTLASVELHAFVRAGERAELTYEYDDGESFAYRRGAYRRYRLTVEQREKTLYFTAREESGALTEAVPALRVCVVAYGHATSVIAPNGDRFSLEPSSEQLTGPTLAAQRSAYFDV